VPVPVSVSEKPPSPQLSLFDDPPRKR